MSEENKRGTPDLQEMKVYLPVEGSKEEELSLQLISKIPDYDDNFTIKDIIQKILQDNKQHDLSKIISAYEFAEKAHRGQKRSSGQDYIIHPLTVAYILLEYSMDTDTICAALLHDVVEDTPVTLEDLKKHFGQDVAILVDGVTKMSKVPTNTKEQQSAENIRKILIAMYQDIRVIIIKLADRLHNMRTLKYRPRNKQITTALETMNIYVSIAHRLGIRSMKEELEDLAFHYLDPFGYEEIEKMLDKRKDERQKIVETIKNRIAERFSTVQFEEPPIIDGRVKSVYSLYKKIIVKGKQMDEIYDKYAVRVIVSTVPECYNVLGIIHDMFTPMDNRFKDYISKPKENKYQSLHTTVTGKEGIPFEVQIRTSKMHQIAEYGIAAHWKYKDGVITKNSEDSRLAWIREILESQQTADDVEEIVRVIKSELSPEDIVVMTPKGRSIQLPAKSNCIDFAYKIHTEIGHKTIGAKVDGRIVPLEYELQTGQICEITVTKDPERGPNRAWLNTVKTSEARSKIRAWFKKECREDNITEGKKELEKAFRRSRINLTENQYSEFLQDDFRRHNCENIDDFYASIGYGGINLTNIIPRLKDKYDRLYGSPSENLPEITASRPYEKSQGTIILDDITAIEKSPAHCCNPLPGDDIIGFITRGHGLKIHTKKCTNYLSALKRADPEELARWREVSWTDGTRSSEQSRISVLASDRVGLAFDITAAVSEARMPIIHSSARVIKNGNALFECTVSITSKEQLQRLIEKIKKIKGVISVERT